MRDNIVHCRPSNQAGAFTYQIVVLSSNFVYVHVIFTSLFSIKFGSLLGCLINRTVNIVKKSFRKFSLNLKYKPSVAITHSI